MGIFGKKDKKVEVNNDTDTDVKNSVSKQPAKEKKLTGEKASIHASNEIVTLMKTFESSRMEENEKSKKTAWKITYFFGGLTALSLVAVAGLTPLKETTPYLLRVDNNTGYVDIVTQLKNAQNDYGEEVAKYFLANWVKLRESYDWFTVEDNFKLLLLQSGEAEQSRLRTEYSRPDAPFKVHTDKERVFINIDNVSFINKASIDTGATAQVRFTKRVEPTSGGTYDVNTGITQPAPKITKYVATVVFEWRNAPLKENERILSPLGFTVISYRTDIDGLGQ